MADQPPAPAPAEPVTAAPAAPPSPDYAALYARAQKILISEGFASVEAFFDRLESASTAAPDTQPQGDPMATQPTTPPVTPQAAPTPQAAASAIPPAPVAAASAGAPTAQQADDIANDRKLPPAVRDKWRKYRDEMNGKLTAEQQRAQQHETQSKAYKADIDRMQAEESMKIELVRAGVRELDYAWFEWKKHLKAMSADETPEGKAAFAELSKQGLAGVQAWATAQRASRPFLFGEMQVPATTGAVTGMPPAPPVPGAAGVSGTTAAAGAFNGRAASADEFNKRMQAMGVNYTGARPPRT